jgi:hypothetical protein
MAVFYKRNTDLYISKASNASANATNTVQLNVKDFSYNQNSSVVEVSRSTLDPTEARTVDPHIANISPVNFTFTTYVLPTVDTNVTSPEEYLWASLMGVDNFTSTPTQSTIDFANGNVAELQNLTLWFDQPTQPEGNYRIDNAIVDSATINFDINGIAEIQWSGRALNLVEDNIPPTATDRTRLTNYIKNRPSTIALNMNSVDYTLALTGGTIRIDNSVRFYGRTIIGKTTVPVGHYTGDRRVSGDLKFYMRSGTSESVDLFNTILTNASTDAYESTYLASLTINVGGLTHNPRLNITVPQALLSLGRKEFSELISVTVPFIAKEEAGNYLSIIYVN